MKAGGAVCAFRNLAIACWHQRCGQLHGGILESGIGHAVLLQHGHGSIGAIVDVLVLVAEEQRYLVGQIDVDTGTHRPVLELTGVLWAISHNVVNIAVAAFVRPLKVGGNILGDPACHIALGADGVETAIGRVEDGRGLLGWLVCGDENRAASGVAAEQGALWALKDLDATDIQQLEVSRQRIGRIEAILINPDVRACTRRDHR